MTATPNLALSYLVASQAQKEVTHNDALNDLDSLTQLAVIDRTLNTAPVSLGEGDTYIVGPSPVGVWAGKADNVAAYYSGWRFKTPQVGWKAWARNENKLLYYSGSAWVPLAAPYLDGTFTWNPGTLANGSGATSAAVTVAGAAFGDFVQVAAPYDLQGVLATAYVSAANTVVARLQNQTGGGVTLASGTWRVRVSKA
ncbi:MAG: DUF2793 domain-containing protein [Alphaproteobacteria bacterium]|nr:DUF2793 domain-containing protein [Alphaproteobacteria bacterium]